MESKTKLGIVAALIAFTVIGWIVIHPKRKKRDEQAAAFFSELERTVAPATEGIAASNAFDIKYWQRTDIKPIYMKQSYAQDFAKQIHSAWGGLLDDNEDKIYGVFRALRDQVQVSQIAWQYYQLYKINLIDELRSRMSPEEIGVIMEIVNKMLPYRENKKK